MDMLKCVVFFGAERGVSKYNYPDQKHEDCVSDCHGGDRGLLLLSTHGTISEDMVCTLPPRTRSYVN